MVACGGVLGEGASGRRRSRVRTELRVCQENGCRVDSKRSSVIGRGWIGVAEGIVDSVHRRLFSGCAGGAGELR